jgi:hypothetical protein
MFLYMILILKKIIINGIKQILTLKDLHVPKIKKSFHKVSLVTGNTQISRHLVCELTAPIIMYTRLGISKVSTEC